ncbi:imidazole glycerol phosphate synthase subunit HisH [Tsuneonella sp. HG094]
MSEVLIVDYGMGNIGSLRNMFRRIGVETEVASDAGSIERARRILLPGVGAFDAAMRRINDLRIADPLRERARTGNVPFLGICLGMQLLGDASEEGGLPGLGLIPATARRFPAGDGLKVPHMGWNVVRRTNASPLTEWMTDEEETRFYFVHSYAVETADPTDTILSCRYGIDFAAGIARDNVYGAQFHPEKSHRFGMRLLSAFVSLPC